MLQVRVSVPEITVKAARCADVGTRASPISDAMHEFYASRDAERRVGGESGSRQPCHWVAIDK